GWQIEVRCRPDPEAFRVVGELRASDLETDLREVDVLRETEGVGHVEEAMRMRRRAHEVVAPRLVGLVRVVHTQLLGRVQPVLESRRPGNDLEDRAGWVETLRGAIQEGVVGVVAQLVESGILLGRVDDLIRVVGRDADRGEYRAGPRGRSFVAAMRRGLKGSLASWSDARTVQ